MRQLDAQRNAPASLQEANHTARDGPHVHSWETEQE